MITIITTILVILIMLTVVNQKTNVVEMTRTRVVNGLGAISLPNFDEQIKNKKLQCDEAIELERKKVIKADAEAEEKRKTEAEEKRKKDAEEKRKKDAEDALAGKAALADALANKIAAEKIREEEDRASSIASFARSTGSQINSKLSILAIQRYFGYIKTVINLNLGTDLIKDLIDKILDEIKNYDNQIKIGNGKEIIYGGAISGSSLLSHLQTTFNDLKQLLSTDKIKFLVKFMDIDTIKAIDLNITTLINSKNLSPAEIGSLNDEIEEDDDKITTIKTKIEQYYKLNKIFNDNRKNYIDLIKNKKIDEADAIILDNFDIINTILRQNINIFDKIKLKEIFDSDSVKDIDYTIKLIRRNFDFKKFEEFKKSLKDNDIHIVKDNIEYTEKKSSVNTSKIFTSFNKSITIQQIENNNNILNDDKFNIILKILFKDTISEYENFEDNILNVIYLLSTIEQDKTLLKIKELIIYNVFNRLFYFDKYFINKLYIFDAYICVIFMRNEYMSYFRDFTSYKFSNDPFYELTRSKTSLQKQHLFMVFRIRYYLLLTTFVWFFDKYNNINFNTYLYKSDINYNSYKDLIISLNVFKHKYTCYDINNINNNKLYNNYYYKDWDNKMLPDTLPVVKPSSERNKILIDIIYIIKALYNKNENLIIDKPKLLREYFNEPATTAFDIDTNITNLIKFIQLKTILKYTTSIVSEVNVTKALNYKYAIKHSVFTNTQFDAFRYGGGAANRVPWIDYNSSVHPNITINNEVNLIKTDLTTVPNIPTDNFYNNKNNLYCIKIQKYILNCLYETINLELMYNNFIALVELNEEINKFMGYPFLNLGGGIDGAGTSVADVSNTITLARDVQAIQNCIHDYPQSIDEATGNNIINKINNLIASIATINANANAKNNNIRIANGTLANAIQKRTDAGALMRFVTTTKGTESHDQNIQEEKKLLNNAEVKNKTEEFVLAQIKENEITVFNQKITDELANYITPANDLCTGVGNILAIKNALNNEVGVGAGHIIDYNTQYANYTGAANLANTRIAAIALITAAANIKVEITNLQNELNVDVNNIINPYLNSNTFINKYRIKFQPIRNILNHMTSYNYQLNDSILFLFSLISSFWFCNDKMNDITDNTIPVAPNTTKFILDDMMNIYNIGALFCILNFDMLDPTVPAKAAKIVNIRDNLFYYCKTDVLDDDTPDTNEEHYFNKYGMNKSFIVQIKNLLKLEVIKHLSEYTPTPPPAVPPVLTPPTPLKDFINDPDIISEITNLNKYIDFFIKNLDIDEFIYKTDFPTINECTGSVDCKKSPTRPFCGIFHDITDNINDNFLNLRMRLKNTGSAENDWSWNITPDKLGSGKSNNLIVTNYKKLINNILNYNENKQTKLIFRNIYDTKIYEDCLRLQLIYRYLTSSKIDLDPEIKLILKHKPLVYKSKKRTINNLSYWLPHIIQII